MLRDPSALSDLLKATPFARGGADAVRDLASLFHGRRADKGELVFLEGEPGGSFFVVSEGRLKAFRRLPGGREITVFLLRTGDFFGFLPLLDGGPYPLSVEALEPCTFYVLERPPFLRFVKENPDFCALLMADLAQRLRGCLDQIARMGRHGAVERAAQGLLSLIPAGAADTSVAEVALPFTQEEFARTLHLAPENLSRALANLRRQGLIERSGKGRFRILDPQGLSRIVGD